MTPIEIRDALRAIALEAGPKAYCSLTVIANPYKGVASACLYPSGITDGHRIEAGGDTFEEAIVALREAWDKAQRLVDKNAIRKMALAIIEITTDQGACSDCALRGAGFYQHQINRMGKLACEEATRLAAGGPFAIVSTVGANDLAA